MAFGLRFVVGSIRSGTARFFADHLAPRLQILLLLMILLELLVFLMRLAFMDDFLLTQRLAAKLLLWLIFETLLINFAELIETLVFI